MKQTILRTFACPVVVVAGYVAGLAIQDPGFYLVPLAGIAGLAVFMLWGREF